jgi:hypothetical protein
MIKPGRNVRWSDYIVPTLARRRLPPLADGAAGVTVASRLSRQEDQSHPIEPPIDPPVGDGGEPGALPAPPSGGQPVLGRSSP